EASGIWSTALSFVTLYRDPVVAENTRTSDFRLRDLVDRDQPPVSLYLGIPPGDLTRMKPLIRLFLTQLLHTLTDQLDLTPRDILLLLDELPSLGRVEILQHTLAFLAGYGVRVCLIAQSFNQLSQAYGQDHSLVDNCQVRVTFAPTSPNSAKTI